MKLLMDYDWPGNIRELENAIERAFILEDGDTLPSGCFSWFVGEKQSEKTTGSHKIYSLAELEKSHIKHVLAETGGHKIRAAQLLGIDRKTLYQKIKRYGIKAH
jgi:DNA-binding NtrC family response regulator